ncbi:sugar phosphate isomerase/epimerase and 4-hydroxyphenylpyruvate domain-containing protein [Marinobacterium sp. D7]|uniref:bifunctional sugar phosphate isomerase/epimerase/4-hydroxyphenylpyruvate dioxygenase family protein n=1 Tax=Marinobacterium ramblicola TaxID=2849041 RepID=UPI001C2D9A70|nr:sugar phosphate isomerase/epimerase and 4-hydroxyphenylpyruvate domain-containing protein [Marinobacterium ramblicola]MBV1789522.1 sugar phosphate isomerase/epimerase and 4-hydroxyphenylpyruvate domain-containing protein [Marinobacterium ramblicola]
MKTALATVTLSGSLPAKLEAAAAAGFQGIEIFENDLTQFDGSPADVRRIAQDLGLEIIALQPFRDMEGMPEPYRSQKLRYIQRKFELMHELGTDRFLMCSNVSPYASNDRSQCAADLHEIAELAAKEGLRVGYEALAWGRHIADYEDAWDLIKRADHPNLGINLDTFHMFARGNTLDCLRDEIPVDKIALVQVADAPIMQMDVLQYSRHFRCFPGQGDLPVVEFVQCLKEKGFDDYLSHEIFNDEFRSSSPKEKAVDGMRSLIWLEEQTSKQPNLPEPEIVDVEFVEFAIEGDSGEELIQLCESLGFRETHRHRSKNVSLMRQGDINLILNREPESLAHEHYQLHGVSVCALALATNDLKAMLERADRYHLKRFANQAGPGELNIPALRGVGDSLVYFVERSGKFRFFDIDFVPVGDKSTGLGLARIDHIGQSVANTDFLSTSFFYKSLFDFTIEPSQDLPDIYGLVVSRTAESRNGRVRIPINMSEARQTSPQRFIQRSKGSGFQQIAFECEDIFTAAAGVGANRVLPVPANYYRDIEAKFGLEPELLVRLKQHNLLYDRNEEGGEFFHFYTVETHGVFFEVVQRKGGYNRYGEANAHIRFAAQARQNALQDALE